MGKNQLVDMIDTAAIQVRDQVSLSKALGTGIDQYLVPVGKLQHVCVAAEVFSADMNHRPDDPVGNVIVVPGARTKKRDENSRGGDLPERRVSQSQNGNFWLTVSGSAVGIQFVPISPYSSFRQQFH